MNFLPINHETLYLIISDLHLSAGPMINGRKNVLEDFYADRELCDFLTYYSTEKNAKRDIELIINGDFLDFLAVPFVEYFDDEFWTEEAALEKIKFIVKAHPYVFKALAAFLATPNKKFVYILGNHDAEMLFPEVTQFFYEQFPLEIRDRIVIKKDSQEYVPVQGLKIKHGHDYERPHFYDLMASVKTSKEGKMILDIPWGFLYVTKVVNRFKEERPYIDSIRPIKTFIIYGLIFDTLFTLRFIFANIFYFFAVILRNIIKSQAEFSIKRFISDASRELHLFQDYEELTEEEFEKDANLKVLIVGHTHVPTVRSYVDDSLFINTGSWVEMFHFDFSRKQAGRIFTYAHIEVEKNHSHKIERLSPFLYVWKGKNDNPYYYFY